VSRRACLIGPGAVKRGSLRRFVNSGGKPKELPANTEAQVTPARNQESLHTTTLVLSEKMAPWFGWLLVVWTVYVTYRGKSFLVGP
jgi:hypothetical protein